MLLAAVSQFKLEKDHERATKLFSHHTLSVKAEITELKLICVMKAFFHFKHRERFDVTYEYTGIL